MHQLSLNDSDYESGSVYESNARNTLLEIERERTKQKHLEMIQVVLESIIKKPFTFQEIDSVIDKILDTN